MRKNIGFVGSWALYWLGHWISIVMHFEWFYWVYPAYNRLMCDSVRIQNWADIDNGPWGPRPTTTK